MPQDWRDLTYLLHGTATQRAAYHALDAFRVFALLGAFDPILAGTIPLDIDVPGSDLDVVCYAADVEAFAQHLQNVFGHCDGFVVHHTVVDGLPTVIGQFTSQGFPIEIFGQPRPVAEQHAVRHMVVEERLLRHGGPEVRRQIRRLKGQGLKTEPAFAVVFGLPGDPYQALLQLAELGEDALASVLSSVPPPP
jgi:uncharacterized protein DUF4269